MWFRARALFAGPRSVDRVRVDQLTGLLLLIASELTTWLGSPTQGRVISAVAGVLLSLAVAVRRRWPLGVILVVLAGWTIGVVIDSRHGPTVRGFRSRSPCSPMGPARSPKSDARSGYSGSRSS